MNIKILALAFGGVLLVGCLTGCGTAAASPEGNPPLGAAAPQASDTPVRIDVANVVEKSKLLNFSTIQLLMICLFDEKLTNRREVS